MNSVKTIQKGFTIVELLVSVGVILLLVSVLLFSFNPMDFLKKSRDNKRMSDLSLLDRIITEYKVDNGIYPDTANTLRSSDILPTGQTSLTKASSGWTVQNLSEYNPRLPLDPLNQAPYVYKYIYVGDLYELNATLEINFAVSGADGGNDNTVYELGNGLTLISP